MDEWTEQRNTFLQKATKLASLEGASREPQFPLPPDNQSLIIVSPNQTLITMKDLYYNLTKIQDRKLGRIVALSKLKQFISQVQGQDEESSFVTISLSLNEISERLMKHRAAFDRMVHNDRHHLVKSTLLDGLEDDISFGEIRVNYDQGNAISFVVKDEDQARLKSEYKNSIFKTGRKYRIVGNVNTASDAMSDFSEANSLGHLGAVSEGNYKQIGEMYYGQRALVQQRIDENNGNREFSDIEVESRSKRIDAKRRADQLPYISSPYPDARTTSSCSPVSILPRNYILNEPRDSNLSSRMALDSLASFTIDSEGRSPEPGYLFQLRRPIISKSADRSFIKESELDQSTPCLLKQSAESPIPAAFIKDITEPPEAGNSIPEIEAPNIQFYKLRRRDKSSTYRETKTRMRHPSLNTNTKQDISSVYGGNNPKPERVALPKLKGAISSKVTRNLTPRIRV